MFEIFVIVALLSLIISVLTVLVRLTRTRDAVWKNQQLLYEIISEQREQRTWIEETGNKCRIISNQIADIKEADIRAEDQIADIKQLLLALAIAGVSLSFVPSTAQAQQSSGPLANTGEMYDDCKKRGPYKQKELF